VLQVEREELFALSIVGFDDVQGMVDGFDDHAAIP
jgi:hypothetical protein